MDKDKVNLIDSMCPSLLTYLQLMNIHSSLVCWLTSLSFLRALYSGRLLWLLICPTFWISLFFKVPWMHLVLSKLLASRVCSLFTCQFVNFLDHYVGPLLMTQSAQWAVHSYASLFFDSELGNRLLISQSTI